MYIILKDEICAMCLLINTFRYWFILLCLISVCLKAIFKRYIIEVKGQKSISK